MEQNTPLTDFYFSKFSIHLYDDYFCVKFKKQEILYAYIEIKTIDKLMSSVNGATSVEFIFNCLKMENYKERLPLHIPFRPKNRRDILLLEHVRDLILSKKIELCENPETNVYPSIVKKERDFRIAQKPFGTDGWIFLFRKAESIGDLLLTIPIINIIPIIWYLICKKHMYY